jgi:hypothetical protein
LDSNGTFGPEALDVIMANPKEPQDKVVEWGNNKNLDKNSNLASQNPFNPNF